MMRSSFAWPAVAALLALAGCSSSGDAEGSSLALRDPYAILDEIVGPLRLFVLPADAHACDPATGTVANAPGEDPAAEADDAIVDITFAIADGATVQVPAGSYSVLVRGRGTDVTTGEMDVVIGTGCTAVAIQSGQTTEIEVEVKRVLRPGVCGNMFVSQDEQCDDGNTTAGDGCSADCRTEGFVVNTTTTGDQVAPAIGWRDGARALVTWTDSTEREVKMTLRTERGGVVTSPSALAVDVSIEPLPAVQTETTVAIAGARAAVAFSDFSSAATEGGDVRVLFVDLGNRATTAPSVLATAQAGAQTQPSIAATPSGATFVVFADSTSPSGLHGRLFAAGTNVPSGDGPVVVGMGTAGASAPSVAAAGEAFVAAFAAGGDVYVQRFDASGAGTASMPVLDAVDATGDQGAPVVAGMADGRAIIAFVDATAGARARVLGPDGMFAGPAFTVPTTAGGVTSLSAGATRDRFVVAWQHGAGDVRARVFDRMGAPALNHESMPSADDFLVATGGATDPAVGAGGPSAEGLFMVVWAAGTDIQGRVFPLP